MAVITYKHPVAGLAAPAAARVADLVTFVIAATATAAVTVTATHNMGISAADLALGFPEVVGEPLYAVAGTEPLNDAGAWICIAKDANTVQMAKAATGAAASPVVQVSVLRPHTIAR
jgi:hypothetical protein